MVDNREKFDELFINIYPEAIRYTYKIIQSRLASQTRITPKDILNDVYLNMINNPHIYQGKSESRVKNTILQDCKWKLSDYNYYNQKKFKLFESIIATTNNIDREIDLDSYIETQLPMSDQNHYNIDVEPYLKCIKEHKDKIGAEIFIEHLRDGSYYGKQEYLCKKYNVTQKQLNSIYKKFIIYLKSRMYYEAKYGKKYKRKISPSKIKVFKFDNNISEKQKEIEIRYNKIQELLSQKVSKTKIAQLLNINRGTVYQTLNFKKT